MSWMSFTQSWIWVKLNQIFPVQADACRSDNKKEDDDKQLKSIGFEENASLQLLLYVAYLQFLYLSGKLQIDFLYYFREGTRKVSQF